MIEFVLLLSVAILSEKIQDDCSCGSIIYWSYFLIFERMVEFTLLLNVERTRRET